MRIQDLIAHKRDGGTLSAAEIDYFVDAYTRGALPDYQVSALLMAIYLRGMDDAETARLTQAMAASGRQLDLDAGLGAGRPTLDKHSTGGVGDKASLIVVPLLAAAGASVCKMSGRGLGHTGGTLDKLESIPGFRVGLTPEEMVAQVARIGACLAGQTEDLAPADKKLYALRDATSTVGSLPLIVSSILSKKLAGGAAAFVLDVKVGSGALMKSEEEARALARALVAGAEQSGRHAIAVLSDMSQPLGRTIGNALEVEEAIQLMTPGATQMEADPRLRELCLRLAAEGILLAGFAEDERAAFDRAGELLASGAALESFRAIVQAQGGDTTVVDNPEAVLARAPVVVPVPAPISGYVASIDTARLGTAVVALGGGRAHKEDTIDPSVGLIVDAPVGYKVEAGEPLVHIHARSEAAAEKAAQTVTAAYTLSSAPVIPPPLILGVLNAVKNPTIG